MLGYILALPEKELRSLRPHPVLLRFTHREEVQYFLFLFPPPHTHTNLILMATLLLCVLHYDSVTPLSLGLVCSRMYPIPFFFYRQCPI